MNEIQKVYYSAKDIAEMLDVSKAKAYEIIRNLNDELNASGFITLQGKVPKAYCQTAHCGRGKPHFIFGGFTSPIVPYRNLPQAPDGMTANCHSLV